MSIRVTKALEEITGRKCFETYRRCLDQERLSTLDYDACDREFMSQQGETRRHGESICMLAKAVEWRGRDPAIKFFLDGSRRTYKIVDMPIGSQVFPVVAGQVGVGVCQREDRKVKPCRLSFGTVLAVPDKINHDGGGAKQNAAYCADLMNKINAAQNRVRIDAIICYSSMLKDRENFEDKAVARIQEYMVEHEKMKVAAAGGRRRNPARGRGSILARSVGIAGSPEPHRTPRQQKDRRVLLAVNEDMVAK